MHQLAGYLLLDYEDEYALNKVGFYLSRQGQLVTWSTQEFLDLLGARRSLSELRAALCQTLRGPALAAPPQRRSRRRRRRRTPSSTRVATPSDPLMARPWFSSPDRRKVLPPP
ncbi:hypothetical protein ACFQZ0_00485 [Streptomyces erythrogriseus]